MSPKVKEAALELLSLPASSRALLAEKLIESLDQTEDSNVEYLWSREVRKRTEEVMEKKVTLKSSKKVFANARKKIK